MSAERIKAAMAHYGLDWDDPIYDANRTGNPHMGWCTVCHRHYEDRHTRFCDLEKARRDEIQELGYPCRTCYHCNHVYPAVIDRGGICPACKVKQDRRDAAVRRKFPKSFTWSSGGVRIPDGLGCSEKVPRWMVDWDGNPDG